MSNIGKRALRKAAMHAKTTDDWGCDADNFHDKATPDVVLALLDELEVATDACNGWQRKFAEADERLEGAEKRIAELEAREVKPVAWRLINSPESSLPVTDNKHIADVWKRNGRDVQALFTAPPVSLVPVGTVLSDGRQMSVHNKSVVVDVVVESGKLIPGDKLYIAAAAGKGETS